MREVCGAVSGALMVLGLMNEGYDPSSGLAKKEHYERVQEFARRFREENGSIICRELLEGVNVTKGVAPEERTQEYYKKRPCPELVYIAAKITDDMLGE